MNTRRIKCNPLCLHCHPERASNDNEMRKKGRAAIATCLFCPSLAGRLTDQRGGPGLHGRLARGLLLESAGNHEDLCRIWPRTGILWSRMQPKSDAQLLRDYAECGTEAAFDELVHRHTNLVYSAALRQVNSPDGAAEIAQRVFIALARGAQELTPRLAGEASLAGWLCRVARNLSLKFRRDEFRRLSPRKGNCATNDVGARPNSRMGAPAPGPG